MAINGVPLSRTEIKHIHDCIPSLLLNLEIRYRATRDVTLRAIIEEDMKHWKRKQQEMMERLEMGMWK